jgi:hypothetical protein
MPTEVFAEYVGLTAEAVALIEGVRNSPSESKSDILIRVLAPVQKMVPEGKSSEFKDYGEGIRIRYGEQMFLFLTKTAKDASRPDARGEVRPDAFYLDGTPCGPSHKRPFQQAMRKVQERKGHVDQNGKPTSLSSMRQWHVVRDGQFRSLDEIKDPRLRRRRGRHQIDLSGLDLGALKIQV